MPIKRTRAKHADLAAVKRLRDELLAFTDQFDVSDPEQTEVELDTHISNLITAGLIKVRKKQDDPHLDDVLSYILKIPADDELIENARQFRTLISSYGGEPSDADMEEAYEILTNIIETISGMKGLDEAHEQD
jgi:hypothetical protein